MIQESGNQALTVDDVKSPDRHVLWKLARVKPTGAYLNEEIATVASKIVSIFFNLSIL